MSGAFLSSTCNYKAPSAAVCGSLAVLSTKCYMSGESGGWAIEFTAAGLLGFVWAT